MSVVLALLLASMTAADQAATPAPETAASAAPAPKKAKKVCKADDLTSGTRMAKRICLTEEEWAERNKGMTESARSGFSGKAEDN
ncbi:MAG TPA: hypothetical protein VJM15_03630 [Sphingomicrobium sp.]|nr:hypothetical protein [Sphingomicrobium sp.]